MKAKPLIIIISLQKCWLTHRLIEREVEGAGRGAHTAQVWHRAAKLLGTAQGCTLLMKLLDLTLFGLDGVRGQGLGCGCGGGAAAGGGAI